ncbi:hypothetical protein QJS10_CPA09g00833 [Acorus calamus]|uniref:Uncharacterized protein n=1 Tax=Acorus calamus TaxID=4465 RepID=A0AAV9E4X9_ACOCL|nr:hypothetical protein QJS10_CPA09g00833 [Acorus calamus]
MEALSMQSLQHFRSLGAQCPLTKEPIAEKVSSGQSLQRGPTTTKGGSSNERVSVKRVASNVTNNFDDPTKMGQANSYKVLSDATEEAQEAMNPITEEVKKQGEVILDDSQVVIQSGSLELQPESKDEDTPIAGNCLKDIVPSQQDLCTIDSQTQPQLDLIIDLSEDPVPISNSQVKKGQAGSTQETHKIVILQVTRMGKEVHETREFPSSKGKRKGGDFNEVRFGHERVGGNSVHSRRLCRFNSCLFQAGIEDLKSVGNYMSWSNRQNNRIMCPLNKVLGNQAFISAYPYSFVEYFQPGISDHSPLKMLGKDHPPSPLLSMRPGRFKLQEAQKALHQTPHDPLTRANEAAARLKYRNTLHQEELFVRQKSK